MAMQPRERVLALSLGAFAVALVLYFAFGRYQSMFTTRDVRLTKLRKDVADKKMKVALVDKAIANGACWKNARCPPTATRPARCITPGSEGSSIRRGSRIRMSGKST